MAILKRSWRCSTTTRSWRSTARRRSLSPACTEAAGGLEEFFAVVAHHAERDGEDHIPQVHELIAQGDYVVAIGSDKIRSRATRRIYEGWWVHVIELRDGRIARVREFIDTAAGQATFLGEGEAQRS